MQRKKKTATHKFLFVFEPYHNIGVLKINPKINSLYNHGTIINQIL